MRTHRSSGLSVIALALVACGGGSSSGPDGSTHPGSDAFVPQDAPPGPYGCLAKPIPTVAPDPLTLGGSAFTLSGTSIVAATGVAITALGSDGSTLGTATTDSNGSYSISLASGGKPVDVHVTGTKSGDRDSTLYPATSLYEDSAGGDVVIITQDDFNLLAELSSETQDASKGAVGVIVLDCDGSAVSGATVTTSPAGDVVYVANDQPDTSATTTDSSGVALIFNVPAGDATLAASAGGMTLRSHAITAAAGVTTIAAIRP